LAEETVVTSSYEEQPISEAPSNIYVIRAEDIEQSGASDLPTLLRLIPGMSVIERTGGQFNVSVRGNNQELANKMLLLIDGRSAYIDTQGVSPWKDFPVALQEIQRVEVLKGPAASIYGFNAFDGVINIITKTPEEAKGITAQVGGGEFGTIRSTAMYANQHDSLGYRLAYSHDENDQWRNRDSLAYRANRFNGMLEYRLWNQANIRVEGGINDTNRLDAAAESVRIDTPNTQSYARIGYEQEDFFVRAFWSRQDATVDFNPVSSLAGIVSAGDADGNSSNIPFDNNTYDVVAQGQRALSTTHTLIAGLNYRHNSLSSTQITSSSNEDRLGFYLQDEWRPLRQVWLTAGMRLDLHSEINPTYSPRIALFYSPIPNHTIRLSGTVGYRSPTLLETNAEAVSTVTLFGFTTTNTLKGSSNLKPEKIVSYEAEYQGWFWNHRIRPRLALFWNHITDLIGVEVGSMTSSAFSNTSGVADIRGFEVSLEFLAAPWLRGFANYSYQDTKQSITGSLRRGGPTSMVNGGFNLNFDNGLNGNLVVHYVGDATYPVSPEFAQFSGLGLIPPSAVPDERVPSYTLVNLRGGYWFWNKQAELAISVFNTFNDRHRESPIGDVIKSRVMGWFTLKLP
jgi:iron complex outermembrane receptor protein